MSVEKEIFFCCWSGWIFARGVFPLALFFFQHAPLLVERRFRYHPGFVFFFLYSSLYSLHCICFLAFLHIATIIDAINPSQFHCSRTFVGYVKIFFAFSFSPFYSPVSCPQRGAPVRLPS
jgi:hypothetical protein